MGDGWIWQVVGGADRGGILAREGRDVASELLPERLAHGALVLELSLDGERLRYELLTGGGPATGWVSLRVAGKELLSRPGGPVWKVVGGVSSGGILVRSGADTSSEPLPERLATGALMLELALEGERLRFGRLSGSGPGTGWISTRIAEKDRDLVVRVGAAGPATPASATSAAPLAALSREPSAAAKPAKLRVLAMGGSLSCRELMKFQTAQLVAALGKADAEWVFAEGTVPVPWEALAPLLSDVERKAAEKRKALTSWYEDIYHCDRDRPTIEKQFDPQVRVESVSIPSKVELLRSYIRDAGPFDVVVAFSQACIMVHYLAGLLRREGEALPWKVSVFFEGMHIRDEAYFDLFEQVVPHPTVHVFGTASDWYRYAREGWCSPRTAEEYYEDPLVLTHDEGHQLPFQQPRAREVYEAVVAAIRRHACGAGQKVVSECTLVDSERPQSSF